MAQGIVNNSGLPLPLPMTMGGTRVTTATSNAIIRGGSGSTSPYLPTARSVFATNNTSTTSNVTSPTVSKQMLLSVAASNPLFSGATCLYASSAGWTTYTPTVTLVGGAGNTVPTYTTTSGRYTQIGNTIYVQVVLINSSGGTAGAGTGTFTVALPISRGSEVANTYRMVGYALNNTTYYLLTALSPSTSTLAINYFSAINTKATFTGAQQNNAIRELHLSFCYEK